MHTSKINYLLYWYGATEICFVGLRGEEARHYFGCPLSTFCQSQFAFEFLMCIAAIFDLFVFVFIFVFLIFHLMFMFSLVLHLINYRICSGLSYSGIVCMNVCMYLRYYSLRSFRNVLCGCLRCEVVAINANWVINLIAMVFHRYYNNGLLRYLHA